MGDFPPTPCCLKYSIIMIAHTTNAMLNEVTYFRDAFKGRLQQLTRRSREECFTTWNGSSKQIPIIFGGFVRRCVPERLWVKPLLIQQLWPSTLSGRLPGYVVGLVSSLWFLNGTRAPIHDADQRVWSPRPSLKKKKKMQMKAYVSSQAACIREVAFLRSVLCWCTKIMSAFSSDSSSGCWATNARIHCICGKSVCGQRTENFNTGF